MLLIEGTESSLGAHRAGRLLARVKQDIAALGGPGHYAPGLRVGFAGNIAVSVEELSALSADLGKSSVLVVLAVLLVILLYFRWWAALPLLFVPLTVATVISFGLVTLPPFRVDRLNSSTGFLGLDRRRQRHQLRRHLAGALRGGAAPGAADRGGAGRGGLGRAAGDAGRRRGGRDRLRVADRHRLPRLPAVRHDRRGRNDRLLGRDLPAGAVAVRGGRAGDRSGPPPLPREDAPGRQTTARLLGARASQSPRVVVAIAGAGDARDAGPGRHLNSAHLESDFGKLRRRDTWTSGEGYWGRFMDRIIGGNLSPTVILTDGRAEASAVAARLRAEMTRPPLSGLVANVRNFDDARAARSARQDRRGRRAARAADAGRARQHAPRAAGGDRSPAGDRRAGADRAGRSAPVADRGPARERRHASGAWCWCSRD